jgi:DNA repair protein SbcC/Rad50
LVQYKAQLTASEKKQAEAERVLAHADAVVKHAQEAVEEAAAQQDDRHTKVNVNQEQMRALREKLEHRHALTGKEACPTCGSALDNEEVKVRLASEREKWRDDLNHLEQEAATLIEDLGSAKQNLGETKCALSKAEQEQRTADTDLTAATVNTDHDAKDVIRAQKVYDQAYMTAGEWAGELNRLDKLEAELEGLKESSRWVGLQEAQEEGKKTALVAKECRRSLDELPKWTAGERERIRADYEQVKDAVRRCKERVETAKTLARQAGEAFQTVQTQRAVKNAEKGGAEENLKAWSQRIERADQEVIRLVNSLPRVWKSHPASQNVNALNLLKEELGSLSEAPERANHLRTAQREADLVKGTIHALESQLEQIAPEFRRPVPEVEREDQQIREQRERREKVYEEALGAWAMLKQRRQQRAEFEQKRDHAAQECSYYERLAMVFGRQGLQARVIQAAQDLIRHNANETLQRLSRGALEIELREGDGSELDILVRDLSQPGGPVRAFEYLSGGEKYRVAVSLAVGIGQSISGGRSTDTILIDEGFGSLDEDNRVLMVDELRRLSQEVLQGGRVVVISHQEDVCEGFAHRYLITKDEHGYAQIEQILT